MTVGSIGFNHSHDADFVMECPQGPGCWLFLHIRTPAKFTVDGIDYKVKKESAIIIAPTTPCTYSGDGGRYADDWIYFGMTDEDRARLENAGIVFNKPLYLGNTHDLAHTIHRITFEHYSSEVFHQEIEEKYFDILFIKLARAFVAESTTGEISSNEKGAIMAELRSAIYRDPITFSNVKFIAEHMNMSCSGLQHLYKRLFGVNVSSDIIASRILRAKELLVSTNLTLDRIAEGAGYSCTYSFLRQFKDKCGCTPTEFRRTAMTDYRLLRELGGGQTR